MFRFQHKNPDEAPGGFLSDCNVNSLQELTSYADASLKGCKTLENFQFERVGFFTVDRDSSESKVIFDINFLIKYAFLPYNKLENEFFLLF